jgi:hypothetical protein
MSDVLVNAMRSISSRMDERAGDNVAEYWS